jgi:hypothetical protein
MFNKFKRFLVEGGHMNDNCQDVDIDLWKDMELAGEDRMGSKKYVASETKSSASPDIDPQPCNLYRHQPREYLLKTLRVGFNLIVD